MVTRYFDTSVETRFFAFQTTSFTRLIAAPIAVQPTNVKSPSATFALNAANTCAEKAFDP